MNLGEIWRYPVKSLRGQRLDVVELEADAGVSCDRVAFVYDSETYRVVTARTKPGLLGLQGSLDADGEPCVDGHRWDTPEARALIRGAAGDHVELIRYTPPDQGQRFDVLPLTVLTDGAVDRFGFDRRRFRPNLFITGVQGLGEREWAGRALQIGTALVGVHDPRGRCVMTTYDPDTQEQDPNVLRRIVREADGMLALNCWVVRPGVVSVGDRVDVVDLPLLEPVGANEEGRTHG
jgi:MOSC domain-containing protein